MITSYTEVFTTRFYVFLQDPLFVVHGILVPDTLFGPREKKPDNATLVGIVYNSKSHMQSGSSIDLTYLWRYMCNK